MVLTDQNESICYPAATVEDATYTTEQKLYDIVDSRRIDKSITGATQSSFGSKLYQVHGGLTNQKTGLGIVLKVMAGDQVKITCESYYTMPGGGAGSPLTLAVSELLTSFVGSNAISYAKGFLSSSDVSGIGTNNADLGSFISNNNPGTNNAKAFLNYILFDDQMKYVGSGADPVQAGGGYKQHTYFISNPVIVAKSGYIYVFVSNESNLPVYFDNLAVTHTPGPIVEQTAYYPFGLIQQGISSNSATLSATNKKKYNGIDWQNDLGLNEYDAFFRTLDAQTARWWQIDPKVDAGYESISPYASMYNDPTKISDPLGDEGGDCCGGFFDAVVDAGKKILISGAGLVDGMINTASMGLVSSDPFNFRNKLSTDEKGWFDGGVNVGKVAPLFMPGGNERSVSEAPALETPNGVRIKTNEQPTSNRVNSNSNSSGSSSTSNSDVNVTNRAARREVMRREGIPTSQQPKSQSKNASGREYSYETTGSGGKKATKSVQQQTMDKTHQGNPHWEAGTVKTDQSGNVRTNNYRRPKLQNNKSKVYYKDN